MRDLSSKAAEFFAAIGSDSPTAKGVVSVVGLVVTVLTGVLVGWWQLRSASGTTTIYNRTINATVNYVGSAPAPGDGHVVEQEPGADAATPDRDGLEQRAGEGAGLVVGNLREGGGDILSPERVAEFSHSARRDRGKIRRR